MSVTTKIADLYALLDDLTPYINGHYQVIENEENTRVKYTGGNRKDQRWVWENIITNTEFVVDKPLYDEEGGFELVLVESADEMEMG